MGIFNCLCSDATKKESYEELLGSTKADLLLTDPPYCILTRRRTKGDLRDPHGRKNEADMVRRFETVREYYEFTDGWLSKALKSLAPQALAIIWTNFLGKDPILKSAKKHGYSNFWGEYIWAKRASESRGNEEFLRVYEFALVLSSIPIKTLSIEEKPSVWSIVSKYDDGESSKWGNHPNYKPFEVIEPLIRMYSKPSDIVLDPFAGSGSIPAAAVKLNRRAFAMELRSEWAINTQQRLNKIKLYF
jgi:site-specific DNA-methyltransferase (adenine-specific)